MTRIHLVWGAVGALGLWLGFPNPVLHLPLLVLLYPVALMMLGIHAPRPRVALRYGWLTGIVGASAALYWIAVPLHNVGGIPWPLAAPCAMALGAYVAFYGGLFSLAAHALRHHQPCIRGLELGLIWYFLELVRGALFTGFPWLTLSAAFVPWPALLQGASVVGAYALAGVFVTLSCWLTAAVTALAAAPPEVGPMRLAEQSPAVPFFSRPLILLSVSLLGWASLIFMGTWRLENEILLSESSPEARQVFYIEGNIDQNQKWDTLWQQTTVTRYLALSEAALAARKTAAASTLPEGEAETAPASPPQGPAPLAPEAAKLSPASKVLSPLVIWPETSMPFYYQDHPLHGPSLRNFAAEYDVILLLGAPGYIKNVPDRTFQIFNRAFLINTAGQDTGYYDKEHLVPFGEYLPPMLGFDFLKPLLQGVGDFTTGITTAPLRADGISLGMLICYESIFPELAQQRVAAGADVLVNISNDGWFGDSSAADQHLELAAVRAIEQGRWLLRGTNTGISATFDHLGRLVTKGSQFKAQSVPSYMVARTQLTLYHYMAPYIPWLGLALFAFLFILGHLRQRVQITH